MASLIELKEGFFIETDDPNVGTQGAVEFDFDPASDVLMARTRAWEEWFCYQIDGTRFWKALSPYRTLAMVLKNAVGLHERGQCPPGVLIRCSHCEFSDPFGEHYGQASLRS